MIEKYGLNVRFFPNILTPFKFIIEHIVVQTEIALLIRELIYLLFDRCNYDRICFF